MAAQGAKTWFIPDTCLPEPVPRDGLYLGHEAICVLNTGDTDASVLLDFYFEDRPPEKGIPVLVPAESKLPIRLDRPAAWGDSKLPVGAGNATRVRSGVPVIVQYTRVDTKQTQAALMSTIAHPLVAWEHL